MKISGPAGANDATGLLRLASQRSGISSFMVMDVMRAAAARESAGQKVIHMEVGQPATPAPASSIEAVGSALRSNTLGYTLALGSQPLRERIAQHYRDWYGVGVAPERVVVTTGSSGAFVLAFLALFDAGARVALPSPGYPCYRHILSVLGIDVVFVQTGPDTRWMPRANDIEAAGAGRRLDGLLIASPANPTGTMIQPDQLAELVRVCGSQDMWFISDEIYHGLTYGAAQETALKYSERAIVINSFSKYFSMTGWRVGWMVVPPELVRPIERLAQNLYISPPAVAQVAALGAFDGQDELEGNRLRYGANRALLLEELPKLGLGQLAPSDGAFYIYADISSYTSNACEFAARLLNETGIAATPGVDFDEARGQQFLRLSYSGSAADVAEAIVLLKDWPGLKSRKQ